MSATVLKEQAFMAQPDIVPSALPYLSAAAVLEKDAAPAWVKALRATGADVFSRTGLPHPKAEGWQYTSLRGVSADMLSRAASRGGETPQPLIAGAGRIVLVDGRYDAAQSDLPAGVEVLSLMDAAAAEMGQEFLADVGDLAAAPFKALNTAYLKDGFVLRVAKGVDVSREIEVLFLGSGTAQPRILYWIAENAGVTILERHLMTGKAFANSVTAIEAGAASRVKFYRLLKDSTEATHFSHTTLRLGKAAVFEGFSVAIGAALLRQDWQMQLIDSRISASLSGIYMIDGQQCHDTAVVAGHFEPDCQSVQHFKGVIDDQARAVFQGKIHVHRPAQKTDGYQSHHALLLSDRAEANTKPELEIYADDVKCSHGATAGFLNPDALFYLRSRGIAEAEAKALLIDSFLAETLHRISDAAVSDIVAAEISGWLAARAARKGRTGAA